MNAIEIRGLTKSFGTKVAVAGLDMTVPMGAIYGFIGENGSGKSTTEKMVCGLIPKNAGTIKLFGKDHTDPAVRERLGVLIESPGCYPSLTVWDNMMLETANLGIKDAEREVIRILKTVRMEGAAGNKYKNCSLGMKQRVGIAMALLGNPALLILDEPINGLDTDGMRIMREILVDITKTHGCTVLISSHILSELEKIATHYGVICRGRMVAELSASELEGRSRSYLSLKCQDMDKAYEILKDTYGNVRSVDGYIRVYDEDDSASVVKLLCEGGCIPCKLSKNKIGLLEYYTELMSRWGE